MTTEMNENTTTTDTTAGIAQSDRAAAIARLAAKRAEYQGVAQHTEPAPAPEPTQGTADDGLDDLERQAEAEEYGAATSEPDLYGELFDAYEEGDTERFREVMQRRDRRVQNEILTAVEQRQVTTQFMDDFSDIAGDQELLSKTNQRIVELQRQGVPLATAARRAGGEIRRAAQAQGRLQSTRNTSTADAIARMKQARGQRS